MEIGAHVRASGKRMTIQRRLVLEALERAKHHITADEISLKPAVMHIQSP